MALPGKALNLKVVSEQPDGMDYASLIEGITARDESAFAFFYDATSGLLFGLLLLTLGDTAAAEEVLSEAYDEIREQGARVASPHTFDHQHEYFLNWLITTAHRHAFDRLRANRKHRPFKGSAVRGQQGPPALHSVGMSTAEHRKLLAVTLASLSPTQRKMIELAYFSRQTAGEIALKLGQPVAQVKADLQDGMLKLYKLFKDIPAELSPDRRSLAADRYQKQRVPSLPADGEKPARQTAMTLVRSAR